MKSAYVMITEIRRELKKAGIKGFRLKASYVPTLADGYKFVSAVEVIGNIDEVINHLKSIGYYANINTQGYTSDGEACRKAIATSNER